MINSVTIVGNMGQDLKIRYTQDGVPVANFTVAVNEDYTNKDGMKVHRVHWFKVKAFERLAEIVAEYCTKGARIGIRGQLRYSQWQDSEGYNRSLVDIRAREIELLSHKNGDDAFGEDMPIAQEDQDIPF
jgi:single-strand DNA-binding protein